MKPAHDKRSRYGALGLLGLAACITTSDLNDLVATDSDGAGSSGDAPSGSTADPGNTTGDPGSTDDMGASSDANESTGSPGGSSGGDACETCTGELEWQIELDFRGSDLAGPWRDYLASDELGNVYVLGWTDDGNVVHQVDPNGVNTWSIAIGPEIGVLQTLDYVGDGQLLIGGAVTVVEGESWHAFQKSNGVVVALDTTDQTLGAPVVVAPSEGYDGVYFETLRHVDDDAVILGGTAVYGEFGYDPVLLRVTLSTGTVDWQRVAPVGDLVLDADGRIYTIDSNGGGTSFSVYDQDGVHLELAQDPAFYGSGIGIDADDRLLGLGNALTSEWNTEFRVLDDQLDQLTSTVLTPLGSVADMIITPTDAIAVVWNVNEPLPSYLSVFHPDRSDWWQAELPPYSERVTGPAEDRFAVASTDFTQETWPFTLSSYRRN